MLQYKCTTPIYTDFRYVLCHNIDPYHGATVHKNTQGMGLAKKNISVNLFQNKKVDGLIANWTPKISKFSKRPLQVVVVRDKLRTTHHVVFKGMSKLRVILDVRPQREYTYPLTFLDTQVEFSYRFKALEFLLRPFIVWMTNRILQEDKEYLESGNHGYYEDYLKPNLRKDHQLMVKIYEEFSRPVYGAL